MDELKEKYKDIFHFFGCNPKFDKEEKKYKDVYELDGIEWNIEKMYDSRNGTVIPFEGFIPQKLVEEKEIGLGADYIFHQYKLEEGFDRTNLLTDFHSFIKFIVTYHNACNKTNYTEDEVYEYYLDRYFARYNMTRETTINDLARDANYYYSKICKNNMEEIDYEINEKLEEIDGKYNNFVVAEGNYKCTKTPFVESIHNLDTKTSYCEYKLIAGCLDTYSIKTDYVMNQDYVNKEVNHLCELFSLKPFENGKNNVIIMSHECLTAPNCLYDIEFFRSGKANSFGFVVGIEEDEVNDNTAFISYNLNTHDLYMSRITDKTIGRKATKEDKESIYNLLIKMQEKLDLDLLEKEKLSKDFKEKTYKKKL